MSTAAYHYILLAGEVSEVSPFVSHGAIRTPPSSSSHNVWFRCSGFKELPKTSIEKRQKFVLRSKAKAIYNLSIKNKM
ncbi:hypothetical protein OROMI_020801 [Orobanche minor]